MWAICVAWIVLVGQAPPVDEQTFDHARTGWPLDGAHGALTCARCHTTRAAGYGGLSTECSSCHATPARHQPLFALRPCTWCHAPAYRTFTATVFDHGAWTTFPLARSHRVACERCHTAALAARMPGIHCEDCHATASKHGTRFAGVPGGCAACHTAAAWSQPTAFAHGRHTGFALIGKHGLVTCRACHRGSAPSQFEKVQRGCKECHAHAKVHADDAYPDGRFSSAECVNCHKRSEWHPDDPRPGIVGMFHGPRSRFPLVAGHRTVACELCHPRRNARGKTIFDRISPECGGACHADAHAGALGAECSRCHVPGVWEPAKFAHTRYPLEGDHRNAACVACHGTSKRFAGAPRRCADAACHARDDVHRGQLGNTCDRCHLANGDNRFSHALMSRFRLDGAHLTVPCADCHPSRELKPRPLSCGGCHPDPAVHKGMYGTSCERCHTTRSWQPR